MSGRRINFVCVPVDDQDRALAFYRDALGFEVQVDAPYAEDWRWIFLTLPGADTRLNFARRGELSWADGLPALALVSPDVDADAARLAGMGVTILNGPADVPWAANARYLTIRDSEGNRILMESARADA